MGGILSVGTQLSPNTGVRENFFFVLKVHFGIIRNSEKCSSHPISCIHLFRGYMISIMAFLVVMYGCESWTMKKA